MDGIIIVDKPCGPSSHRVVQEVRRLYGGVKAGHGGTLDPLATGVLPVFLGRATRVAEYLLEQSKQYQLWITLGIGTSTGDRAGEITSRETPPSLSREELLPILESFKGQWTSPAPAYSAVKHEGKPLYFWTRQGVEAPRRLRTTTIYSIELLNLDNTASPQVELLVECSKGAYMRSLAAELGEVINCGAHLAALRRTRAGPYDLAGAVTLEAATAAVHAGLGDTLLQPLDSALSHLAAYTLKATQVEALEQGRTVPLDRAITRDGADEGDAPLKVYDEEGCFRALARMVQEGDEVFLRTVKFLVPRSGVKDGDY